MEKIRDSVLEEYSKGNIVCSTVDGLLVSDFTEFMQQPIDGILYDLNRDEATILTFIDEPTWVNNYALTQIVRRLYDENEELKTQLKLRSEESRYN